MNHNTRLEQLRKLIKQAEIKQVIANVDEQLADENQAEDSATYAQKFTDALIEQTKIEGFED